MADLILLHLACPHRLTACGKNYINDRNEHYVYLRYNSFVSIRVKILCAFEVVLKYSQIKKRLKTIFIVTYGRTVIQMIKTCHFKQIYSTTLVVLLNLINRLSGSKLL